MEQICQGKNGKQAGDHAGQNSGEDGPGMFLQKLQLLIERDCQADGGRGQQIAQISGAAAVSVIVDPEKQQETGHKGDGDQ